MAEMNLEKQLNFLIFAAAATLLIALYVWHGHSSTRDALDEWQRESGYTIVKKRRPLLSLGPFEFSTSMQVIYRVTLIDKKGRRRKGWIRCGTWFLGTWVKPVKIQVALDDQVEEPPAFDEFF